MTAAITFEEAEEIAQEKGYIRYSTWTRDLDNRYDRTPEHLKTEDGRRRAYAAMIEETVSRET